MGFAANAVMDVIAPPARPTPAASPDAPSGPSFDDHLDAATADEAPPVEEPAAQDTENNVEAKDTPADDPQVCAPPTAPQPQQQATAMAASLLLQIEPDAQAPADGEQAPLIAAPETPPPTNVAPPAAPVKTAPKQAPTQKAQTGDAEATPEFAPVEEAPIAQAGDSAPQQQTQPQADGAVKQDSAKTTPAPQVLPAPQINVAPATATSQTPAQQQTQTNSADQVQAATSATQAAPRAELQTPPQSKSDAARDEAKSEAAQTKDGAESGKANAATTGASAKADAPVFSVTDAPAAATNTANNAATNQSASALTFSTTHAGHAQHATLEQSTERAAPAATQVGREVIRRFSGGNTKFEMRLDPPELGRVEVRLEVTRDNRVTAVVAADSPQALTELARHARELEQQLQSAGLELTDNGLSFDLRQSRDEAGEADVRGTRQGGGESAETEVATDTPISARPIGYDRWRGVRVDVMV